MPTRDPKTRQVCCSHVKNNRVSYVSNRWLPMVEVLSDHIARPMFALRQAASIFDQRRETGRDEGDETAGPATVLHAFSRTKH